MLTAAALTPSASAAWLKEGCSAAATNTRKLANGRRRKPGEGVRVDFLAGRLAIGIERPPACGMLAWLHPCRLHAAGRGPPCAILGLRRDVHPVLSAMPRGEVRVINPRNRRRDGPVDALVLQRCSMALGAVEGLTDFRCRVPDTLVEHRCVRGARQIQIAVAHGLSEELVCSHVDGSKADQVDGNGDGSQDNEWQ